MNISVASKAWDIQASKRAFSSQNLRYAVLLVEVALLVYLVEQAALAIPTGDCVEVFNTLFFRPDIAHLDDDQRILVFGPRRQQDVRV